ncbi:hypothetical protein FGIG_04064 [Fasciola gigantica]|uniref:Uncharacterized protein n=1 Tax=Fasciola gigantica TaxID=46835 RepID=A0A504Z2C0_FASGI|nr:hypothetical protein FGIG_04064 [Fasciola gigantica]
MTTLSLPDRTLLAQLFYEQEEIHGVVQTVDYEDVLRKHDFSASVARKIADQLDPGRTGNISREHALRTLGLPLSYQPQLIIPRDVNILSSDMGPCQQYSVIHMVRHNMKYLPDMKEVVSRIKTRLDAVYGPLWHVFIIRGQYWAYYSHDTRTGLVFKCDDYIYLMYRSPTES